jgi:hypothetical protein
MEIAIGATGEEYTTATPYGVKCHVSRINVIQQQHKNQRGGNNQCHEPSKPPAKSAKN